MQIVGFTPVERKRETKVLLQWIPVLTDLKREVIVTETNKHTQRHTNCFHTHTPKV